MSTETGQVAVWYMQYGSPDYELCETEEAAASFAAYAMDDGQCAVLGAQFPDGHAVRREDWDAYAAAWTRKIEAETRADDARQARTPPPTRKTRDPFEHRQVEIKVSEPAWLGEGER